MNEPVVNDRWLGATCYLSFLVVIPILSRPRSEFLARHCRQGFALFFVEVVLFLFLWIVDKTVGQIPILGLLVSILLHLAFFLLCLMLSVIGFVKALSGEEWRIPFLDDLADRVPLA